MKTWYALKVFSSCWSSQRRLLSLQSKATMTDLPQSILLKCKDDSSWNKAFFLPASLVSPMTSSNSADTPVSLSYRYILKQIAFRLVNHGLFFFFFPIELELQKDTKYNYVRGLVILERNKKNCTQNRSYTVMALTKHLIKQFYWFMVMFTATKEETRLFYQETLWNLLTTPSSVELMGWRLRCEK